MLIWIIFAAVLQTYIIVYINYIKLELTYFIEPTNKNEVNLSNSQKFYPDTYHIRVNNHTHALIRQGSNVGGLSFNTQDPLFSISDTAYLFLFDNQMFS